MPSQAEPHLNQYPNQGSFLRCLAARKNPPPSARQTAVPIVGSPVPAAILDLVPSHSTPRAAAGAAATPLQRDSLLVPLSWEPSPAFRAKQSLLDLGEQVPLQHAFAKT